MPTDRGRTSDFSPVAARYDATRHVPPDLLRALYGRLAAAGLFPRAGRVLDAGCGTGQISLPLAARGYAVTGCDVSAAMVAVARGKRRPGWDAAYAVGDARALPVPDAAFDAALVSKLFQHVADWRGVCRELIRATGPRAPIVHVRDRGALGTAVRRRFTATLRAAGHADLFPGLPPRANAELCAFMAARGRPRAPLEAAGVDLTDLRWRFTVTAGDTLRALRERLFAEFWPVPAAAHAAALAETEAWVAGLPGGEATEEAMTPFLAVDVFRAPG